MKRKNNNGLSIILMMLTIIFLSMVVGIDSGLDGLMNGGGGEGGEVQTLPVDGGERDSQGNWRNYFFRCFLDNRGKNNGN